MTPSKMKKKILSCRALPGRAKIILNNLTPTLTPDALLRVPS